MDANIAKDQHYVYELDMVPGETSDLKRWTTFNLSTTATTTSTLGTGLSSTYDSVAIMWLKKVVDAAKKTFYYEQVCQQETIPQGSDKIAIPKQPILDAEAYETTGEEIAASAEVVWTSIDPCTVTEVTATDRIYGATLSNKLLRTCNIPYVNYVKDKLVYQQFSVLDTSVRDKLVGKHGASPANTATPMSNSAAGLQTIFGGGVSNTAEALVAGCVLTPADIKKAKRLLESDAGYYWNSNTWTKSAVAKNPWKNENDFVLFIAPEQMEALLNDSQFTNAAEFGSDKAVLNGEIARYLGIKIVTTPNVPSFLDTGSIRCQGASVGAGANGHVCTLMKAGKAGVIGWSQKPQYHVFPYPSALQTRMVLEMSFGVNELYADAMVNIAVSDE
jgi:N4-gp56 family major capsid protein